MKIPFEKIYELDLIHPLERDAEREFKENDLYNMLAADNADLINSWQSRPEAMLYLFPVTERTAPRLNALYEIALKRLRCNIRYPLFLKQEFEIRAMVDGTDPDYTIVLSGLGELSDSEILALIGQALGRIKAEHAQTLRLLETAESGSEMIPIVGSLAGKKLWSSFARWLTAAQFTIDRAALFACGSEKVVASLILKQNGLSEFELAQILKQPVCKTKHLGIYFVFLMQSMPSFGGIERIQELHRWTHSEQFRENYPGFYYRLQLECDDCESDDSALTDLHRTAFSGDADTMIKLAEMYMRGEVLPKSKLMPCTLYKEASFLGNAKAMYILAAFLIRDKTDYKAEIQRLYCAAKSRGFKGARNKLLKCYAEDQTALVRKVCADFFEKYHNRTACKVYFDDADAQAVAVANAFWLDADDHIYSYEILFDADNHIYGTAISAKGVFGRTGEQELPFNLSWSNLRKDKVQLRRNTGELISGKTLIYVANGKLNGTVGEIVARIVAEL